MGAKFRRNWLLADRSDTWLRAKQFVEATWIVSGMECCRFECNLNERESLSDSMEFESDKSLKAILKDVEKEICWVC